MECRKIEINTLTCKMYEVITFLKASEKQPVISRFRLIIISYSKRINLEHFVLRLFMLLVSGAHSQICRDSS